MQVKIFVIGAMKSSVREPPPDRFVTDNAPIPNINNFVLI